MTDRRVLCIFLAVILVGAYLIHHQDVVNNDLRHKQDVANYARCEDRAANVIKANAFYLAMARLEESNKFIDQTLRNERVALYRGVVYALPKCGAKP